MKYAILRTQKLKSAVAVHRSMKHAFREQETPNADESRTPENTQIGAANVAEAMERFAARLPEKVRKNGVVAIEYLMTASPEAMQAKSRKEQDDYFRDALEWLKERHGADNVVYAGIHRDETTPHMYAYVVPIDERGRLNARSFLGGRSALSEMQTDYAERVGRQHGLQRGIEGSKAHHQRVQRFYGDLAAGDRHAPTIAPEELERQKVKGSGLAQRVFGAVETQEGVVARLNAKIREAWGKHRAQWRAGEELAQQRQHTAWMAAQLEKLGPFRELPPAELARLKGEAERLHRERQEEQRRQREAERARRRSRGR